MVEITTKDAEWENYLSYVPNLEQKWLYETKNDVIALFTGNQKGKTRTVGQFIWDAIRGILPVEHHNIRPSDTVRTIRCVSEVVPKSDEDSEVKNTQYPVLKQVIPESFIKQDVTQRNPVMVIFDPQGGRDITIEFSGYHQTVQSQAGQQRRIVFLDEHCPKACYDEQLPRLLKASTDIKRLRGIDGNAMLIITLTPAQEYMDWEYDEIFERAEHIYRTKRVIDRLKLRFNEDVRWFEDRKNGTGITVIMSSTYDNPSFDAATVDSMAMKYGDDDIVDIRLYGLFRQISGTVFKSFDYNTHVIDMDKYFPVGLPQEGLHARAIDYHVANPWAIPFVWLSPEDEVFVYDELYPSPEKFVTLDIVTMIANRSGAYRYWLDLIDPLADESQSNTGVSPLDDINRIMHTMWHEGRPPGFTGGFFQTWDTKSERGKDLMRERLQNSRLVGKPFNNLVLKDGQRRRLPTIWYSRKCVNAIEHVKMWRREQWINRNQAIIKDPKDKYEQKYSHFNTALEGLLKSPAFNVAGYRGSVLSHDRRRTTSRAHR